MNHTNGPNIISLTSVNYSNTQGLVSKALYMRTRERLTRINSIERSPIL